MAIAESDARTLLDQFPGLSQITNVYRLLAYAALERQPAQYRAAADFLIQLRDQSREGEETSEGRIKAVNTKLEDEVYLKKELSKLNLEEYKAKEAELRKLNPEYAEHFKSEKNWNKLKLKKQTETIHELEAKIKQAAK